MTTLEKIRAEIDVIEINGQVDEHTAFIRTGEHVKQMALDIIDKYEEQEPTDEWQNGYDMAWEEAKVFYEQEPCDDAEQIDYHDDFETALRKIHDYEERQKQNDKKCGNCKLIGTDTCYMVCGGSKSLYKPKQKSEPCDDAISRQAVLDLIEHYNSDGLGSVFYGYEQGVKFADAVNKLPSVRPQEQTGKWLEHENGRWIYAKCSECKTIHDSRSNYCPFCGARMDGYFAGLTKLRGE